MKAETEKEYSYRTIGLVGAASLCVVLPKEYALHLGIEKGDPVRVTREDGRVVIEKA